jgi:hypothetical protein
VSVPTLSTITPSVGHSGGNTLVKIEGTGFALPPAASPVGPSTAPPPSVTVTIGGRPASNVAVVSSSLIYCLTPKGALNADDNESLNTTAQNVVVQNNHADGTPVVGETATLAAAFTFQQPDLTQESELARVIRALMRELKLQVTNNVVFSTHTDYDASTGDLLNTAMVATLPALILGNLEVPEDRIHAVNEEQDFEIPGGLFIKRRPPVVVDVMMTLVGVSDNAITILNLMQVVRAFFKKTPWLVLDRDASDPTLGTVKYELDWSFAGPVSVSHQADNSNVESFGGQVVVRGVLLEDMPGISTSKPPEIPARFPHEATTGIGGVSADDETAVVVQVPQRIP